MEGKQSNDTADKMEGKSRQTSGKAEERREFQPPPTPTPLKRRAQQNTISGHDRKTEVKPEK